MWHLSFIQHDIIPYTLSSDFLAVCNFSPSYNYIYFFINLCPLTEIGNFASMFIKQWWKMTVCITWLFYFLFFYYNSGFWVFTGFFKSIFSSALLIYIYCLSDTTSILLSLLCTFFWKSDFPEYFQHFFQETKILPEILIVFVCQIVSQCLHHVKVYLVFKLWPLICSAMMCVKQIQFRVHYE